MARKKAFLTAHAVENCANNGNKQCGVAFGSANTAGTINRALAHATTTTAPGILPQVETYMENITAAETTNHRTLEALVASTYRLPKINAAQNSTINPLRDKIKELQAGGTAGRLGG